MKIGRSFDKANLFDKTVDVSDDITEGTTQLFYPDGDKVKVAELPDGAIAYLEIEKADIAPETAEEGQVYYNTTDDKFYLRKDSSWVEVLFSMVEITA